jgi:NAD(P)-dependent dehydrogenase (short-subunit alcohol dehydrogenase family)
LEEEMKGLKGKRIVVGGGATGIGAACVTRLIEEGAHVVVGDINEAGLNKLVPDLAKKGKAIPVVFDLADEGSINSLIERTAKELGGIDGVVIPGADLSKGNLGNDHTVLDMQAAIWERTFRVNTLGHALMMKAAIPHLVKAGGGSIVSVTSGAAYLGLATMPAYACSKAGLHALVRHVARICGKDNIRCNGVSPGLVLTEGAKVNLTEEGKQEAISTLCIPRLGEANDLGSTMVFLLSDDSAWLTGQVISVNGGYAFRD